VSVSSYHVDLVDDGPIVKGANITFIALVYDSDNRPASGSFRYTWQDTAVPTHSKTVRLALICHVNDAIVSNFRSNQKVR
jgi:hypothetical protein